MLPHLKYFSKLNSLHLMIQVFFFKSSPLLLGSEMSGWVIIVHISDEHSHRRAGMMVLGKVLCDLKTSLLCEEECNEELIVWPPVGKSTAAMMS